MFERFVNDAIYLNNGSTPMLLACEQGKLSICKWLLDKGWADDITKANDNGFTPMYVSCQNGHLSVCQWLFEVGATGDITKTNDYGCTPMFLVCQRGHLSVCKWLFEVGATTDITKTSNNGFTPMAIACWMGNLSVCEWLYKIGAKDDIYKLCGISWTPFCCALQNGHLEVCKWLIFNGVLSCYISDFKLPLELSSCNEDIINQMSSNKDIMNRINRLFEWGEEIIDIHKIFFNVVLRASVLVPVSQQNASPQQRCRLPKLPRDISKRVASFLGVEMGLRLRNIRQFKEVMEYIYKLDL